MNKLKSPLYLCFLIGWVCLVIGGVCFLLSSMRFGPRHWTYRAAEIVAFAGLAIYAFPLFMAVTLSISERWRNKRAKRHKGEP